MTATLAGRPARDHGALAFHALVVAFIVLTQFIYTPARDLGPDNTWHYRLAREIVTGEAVHWAGLDGNRLFPDLLFAILAAILSGGALFEGCLPFFYALFFLALYLSLVGLAATLYDEVIERRAFVLLSVAGLWAFELAAPFWPRWFFDPGNHGTGLPVAFACLALTFRMHGTVRFSLSASLALLLAASLLVGSNRFLLIAFLIPLLVALAVLLTGYLAAGRGTTATPGAGLRASWPLPALIGTVATACIGSYLAYKLLGDLNWHRSTTYMGVKLLDNLSFGWAAEKLGREVADLGTFFWIQTKQVIVGPALLLATVPASLVLLVRGLRQGHASRLQDNRLLLGLFTAGSAILSLAFVVWGWNEESEWRYRYLAMATAFAVVFLAMIAVRSAASLARPGLFAGALLASLLALTFVPTFHRDTYGRAERHAKFLRQIDDLTRWVGQHTSARPIRGLGEYWAAMDITARTPLRLDLLDEKARAQFYSSNAGALCRGGYSFLLRKARPDAPKRSEIVGLLGEPLAAREMEVEGHQEVEILVYDPALIQTRITDEGRRAAMRLFPNYSCPPASPSQAK